MSLLENQTYKRKVTYVRADDNEKVVTIVINVQCNHEIDKCILVEIENTISDMLIKDYDNKDEVMEKKKLEKVADKAALVLEKQKEKSELENQKRIQKQEIELQEYREKQQRDYQKQLADEQERFAAKLAVKPKPHIKRRK